jgi:hypothetical protein
MAEARVVSRSETLRHDALGAKFADMGEHVWTFRRNVLAQPDHARLLQQRRQCCLASFERHAAQIAARQAPRDRKHRARRVTAPPAAQRLEIGEPVRPDHDRLAVEREALSFQPSRGFRLEDPWYGLVRK